MNVRPSFPGLVLIVNMLTANYRHVRLPQSRLVSLLLLVRLGLRCPDDIILQRILPTLLISGLEDPHGPVRALSLRGLRSLLQVVQQHSNALEANLFPLYIFPALNRVSKDSDSIVRVAFAECLAPIAEIAKRFLDRTHWSFVSKAVIDNSGGSNVPPPAPGGSVSLPPTETVASENDTLHGLTISQHGSMLVDFPYDKKLEALRDQVSQWIRALMTDVSNSGSASSVGGVAGGVPRSGPNASFAVAAAAGKLSSFVKRVLLIDIMRLCTFYGQEATIDKLVTQLLTFLNDQVR